MERRSTEVMSSFMGEDNGQTGCAQPPVTDKAFIHAHTSNPADGDGLRVGEQNTGNDFVFYFSEVALKFLQQGVGTPPRPSGALRPKEAPLNLIVKEWHGCHQNSSTNVSTLLTGGRARPIVGCNSWVFG